MSPSNIFQAAHLQRHQLKTCNAAGALPDWAGTHQVQHNGNRLALGLDGVQAPQVDLHRHRETQSKAGILALSRERGQLSDFWHKLLQHQGRNFLQELFSAGEGQHWRRQSKALQATCQSKQPQRSTGLFLL